MSASPMHPSAVVLALSVALLLTSPFLGAQQVERESQVPILPVEGVLEISTELRNRLGLFPDVAGFRAARLFAREDGAVVLEVEALRDGAIHRERSILTDLRLTELQEDLASRYAAADTQVLDLEGRGGFVLGHTLLGLAFHGWAVPVALDIDSPQAAVGTYLLTSGAAFLIPYRLSRGRSVGEAHRDLSMYGGTRGILYGTLLGDAVGTSGSHSSRVILGAGVLASAGGSTLGFRAAERFRPDEGSASLWGAMGDFGLAGGAAAAYVSGPYASREVERVANGFTYVESERRNTALGHAITIAGGAGGVLVGGWMGARQSYTEGNVAILRSAGILGAQTGITLTRAGTRNGRGLTAGALAGGIAGVAGGHRLLRNDRFSTGEGLLVNAGHLAGGAAALGLTYLVVSEIDEHPLLYLSTSTAGSLLGAGLVYRALDSRSRVSLGSSGGPTERDRAGAATRPATITLHPENAIATWMAGTAVRGTVERSASFGAAPLLTISF